MSTYEEVAEGLPVDIREAIETSQSCRQAADGGHLWTIEHSETGTWGTTSFRMHRWWQCCYCSITSRADPRPLNSFARRRINNLYTVHDIVRMLTP